MKTLLFDFDGTLVNNSKLFFEGLNFLAKKYGYAPISDFNLIRKREALQFIKSLEIKDYDSFLSDLFEYVNNHEFFFIYGLIEELVSLKKKYNFGIISSNSALFINNFLNKNKVNIFGFVIGNVQLDEKEKIIECLIADKNLKKDELIYIGDEARDIISCKKIGIKIISVSWGINDGSLLKKYEPDCLVNSVNELSGLLNNKI